MNTLKALAAGTLVGIVLVEAVLAGLATLLPAGLVGVGSPLGFVPGWPLLPVPALAWLLGAAAAGAMASALDARALTGLAAGALMGLPAFILVGLATPGNPLAFLAAALPLSGAAAGTVLAQRLRRLDTAASAPDQAL